jgi:asparagine synthase (glutamine-hydrolysing)
LILGWVGEEPGDIDRQVLLRGAATRLRVDLPRLVGGSRWGLILDPGVRFCSDDRSACAIAGELRTHDDTLRNAIARVGAPAALLQAYRREGSKIACRLAGAFSVFLVDADGAQVSLIGDRFGIEPLYYHHSAGRLVFADSMPALLAHSWTGREIDSQAIYDYLFFSMVPSPATGYRASRRLPPGTSADFSGESIQLQRYWHTKYERERARIDYASEAEEFRRLLERAVADEIAGTESVGCFLSGGTDSSTMAGLLAKVTGGPVKTYSIGFDEPGYDEMYYARLAAKRFSTTHREYYVTPRDIADMLERIPAQFATPFGNSSAVPSYYCARMALADGSTKLLGGDGGDELFGGNEFYRTQVMFSKYDCIPRALRSLLVEPLAALFSLRGRVPLVKKVYSYIQQAKMPMPDRLESYNFVHTMGAARMLEPGFLALVAVEHPFDLMREEYDGAAATTMLNRIMSMDVKLTLADNDLRKVGEMARLAGLKVAYPMLHEDLVAFAARLPVDQKVRGLKLRYFFKKALADFLPREIIEKEKHGFGLPFGQWLGRDADLQRQVLGVLHDFKSRRVVRGDFIDELAGPRFLENAGHYGKLIWVFVMLEQWLKQAIGTAPVVR